MPYLYAHETFGPVVGFEIGWLMWITQLGGFASVTNLFVNYLGWFFPAATAGLPRIAIIATVLTGLTVVNILGVRRAAKPELPLAEPPFFESRGVWGCGHSAGAKVMTSEYSAGRLRSVHRAMAGRMRTTA